MKHSETAGSVRWIGQFALYLLLFTLLISAGVYFLMGNEEPANSPTSTTTTTTPKPEAPAGVTGHDAPK